MGDTTQDKVRSSIALGVALLSLVVSSLTFVWSYFRPGELVIHAPTGFCIVRGYTELGFESDHLVIPIVIENTGKGEKIFEQPTLSLTEKAKRHEHQSSLHQLVRFLYLYRSSLDKSYEIRVRLA